MATVWLPLCATIMRLLKSRYSVVVVTSLVLLDYVERSVGSMTTADGVSVQSVCSQLLLMDDGRCPLYV